MGNRLTGNSCIAGSEFQEQLFPTTGPAKVWRPVDVTDLPNVAARYSGPELGLTGGGADLFHDRPPFVAVIPVGREAIVGADVGVGADQLVVANERARPAALAVQIQRRIGLGDR